MKRRNFFKAMAALAGGAALSVSGLVAKETDELVCFGCSTTRCIDPVGSKVELVEINSDRCNPYDCTLME